MGTFESGIYRLVIHYDKDKQVSKTVFFSDIGIVSKLSNDQLFVSASKLSSAQTLKDANVSLYSYKNELIVSGSTDKNGIWIYNKKALSQAYPKAVVVTSGSDRNFLVLSSPLNRITSYNVCYTKLLRSSTSASTIRTGTAPTHKKRRIGSMRLSANLQKIDGG